MNDKLDWIDDELSTLADAGLLRGLNVCIRATHSTELQLDGKTYVNFASNDYLGLAKEIANGLKEKPVPDQAWGSGASPL